MHLSEFKAWFDGFTEEMDGTPTPKQWKKIKERVKEITADYTPPTIFVDRYYYPWRHHWDCVPYWAGTTGVGVSTTNLSAIGSAAGSSVQMADYKSAVSQQVSLSDWTQAGKAEFRAS
mgnify:CR=1 FL=1